jgi:hypothetical protein
MTHMDQIGSKFKRLCDNYRNRFKEQGCFTEQDVAEFIPEAKNCGISTNWDKFTPDDLKRWVIDWPTQHHYTEEQEWLIATMRLP